MGADGLLHVFYALVGNANGTGANTGAAPDGAWIARIDPTSLNVVGFGPAPDDDGRVLYGWSVETSGAYSYLFGHSYDQFNLPDPTSPKPNRTFLARVPRRSVRRDARSTGTAPAGRRNDRPHSPCTSAPNGRPTRCSHA